MCWALETEPNALPTAGNTPLLLSSLPYSMPVGIGPGCLQLEGSKPEGHPGPRHETAHQVQLWLPAQGQTHLLGPGNSRWNQRAKQPMLDQSQYHHRLDGDGRGQTGGPRGHPTGTNPGGTDCNSGASWQPNHVPKGYCWESPLHLATNGLSRSLMEPWGHQAMGQQGKALRQKAV